jgi:glycosyltransferase involved in cell wall biosynthesis
VSIALPVHNGEAYLAQAIQSILDQTFRDFELIILDNASTDRTHAICMEFKARDGRVRYVQRIANVGAAPNFNDGFLLARGEFFRWHAHDDWIEREYLQACVESLDANPNASLCHTLVRRVDADGNDLEIVRPFGHDMGSPWRHERVRGRLRNQRCLEVFGLIQRSAVKLAPPIGSYIGMDRVFLLDLALSGPFVLFPWPLFVQRLHNARSCQIPRRSSRQALAVAYDASNAGRAHLSSWRLLAACVRVIRRNVPSRLERLRCYWHLRHVMRQQHTWAYLALDPLTAMAPAAHALAQRVRRPFRKNALAP